ncbi:PLP-dependent aminotransferase family protein [Streptomyces cellulosae]|uniref:MocR-like pyridoxine biosynthesis transcription factor PdxR n=1 Tax=Streptomyces TaxID=1883 RepID=UPI00136AD1F8|nr:PLP-dependent aminotransferase family protein [Streptomyces cellulosae]MDX3412750.1 PLP-dependent aminotransferase family protein [Streptomyces sp. MD20-1-1]MYQ34549.1 aminotransferase class I/II-fold pyridoxal phosphate-dependent enzyme [Streptomyces sp. SID4956]WSB92901.1 PLP-dependent aminotransferase family protein [Streptomyces cellulosae]WTC56351.1 PLP-dependent aminotransferase family protein [Streptomyces cellulosae]
MAERWATFGIDLHLDPSGPGLRRGLTDALREAVRGGRLAPGTRLPSSRALAADLGIARNTVADAYADLIAEGWLTARQGSGTRVAPRAVPERPAAPTPSRVPGRLPYSLMPGTPDLASFPRAEWLKATRRALAAAPHDAFGYGDPRGRPELREALAGYLSRVRGVRADPGHVVVCSGFAHGLQLLAQVLRARGARTLAVEPYGLDAHWDIVHRAGLKTAPLGRDALGTRAQDPGDADAVLLNPAHQFPLGGALLPERRAAVVEWARRTGGLILEDDYDGEFRYDRQPVGALQDLDPGRVVHLGTASKSLAPGLRLGWMVVPPWLLPDVVDHRGGMTVSVVEQLTLAEFLTSGAYDRQVRAARLRYRRRRDALVQALAAGAPHVRVTGIAAGLHAVLELPAGTEQSVQRSATWQGLAVKGLDSFRHPGVADPVGDALVVGYATPPDHAWTGTLDALLRSLP